MRNDVMEGVSIIQLPDGRLVLLLPEFEGAANDRYRESAPRFKEGSKALWDEVMSNKGEVDFYTARQFIESHAQKLFQQNREISDIRTRQPLKTFGFETVINLYESMTERPMKDNSLYLDLLNRSIELTPEELKEWTAPVRKFWAADNIKFIERKWEEAKREGVIAKSEGSFAETMADEFASPELISKGAYLRRHALLQFISDAYSDYTGEERVQIELIEGPDSLGGFHTRDENTGNQVIGINVANFAFQSNFQSIMNVLNHERYHASDQMLADTYKEGKIGIDDARYKRARIAAAAMDPNGYISTGVQAGQLAYREQVIEVGAHYAGKVAEYHAHETYAQPPEPVISLRKDKEREVLSKEYEDMELRKSRFRYPEGLSPYGGMGMQP